MTRGPHRTGHRYRQARAAMFAQHGTVCVICGHDGAGDAGHVQSLKNHPHQETGTPSRNTGGGLVPMHGVQSRCPVCGRCCNQELGSKDWDPARDTLTTSEDW